MKSDVELFWDKIKILFGMQTDWTSLTRGEQYQVVHGINMILGVVNARE